MNIKEGVALCPGCATLSPLSDCLEAAPAVLPAQPPPGCGITDDGRRTVITSTTRSWVFGGSIGLFAIAWNSFLVFFISSMFWGSQTQPPNPSNPPGGPPTGLFMMLFMIPFVVAGIGMAGAALVGIFGTLRIEIDGPEGIVSTGVGPFAWKRRFDASAVRRVSMGKTKYEVNHRQMPVILIEADRTIRFGSTLTEARSDWLLATLRTLLRPQSRAQSGHAPGV